MEGGKTTGLNVLKRIDLVEPLVLKIVVFDEGE